MTITLTATQSARAATLQAGERILLIQVVEPQPRYVQALSGGRWEASEDGGFDQDVQVLACPFGAPGDVVGVKEAVYVHYCQCLDCQDCRNGHPFGDKSVVYTADGGPWHDGREHGIQLGAGSMPEEFIRSHLTLTEPQVKRASDVTIGEWVLADVDPATVAPDAWVWLVSAVKQ